LAAAARSKRREHHLHSVESNLLEAALAEEVMQVPEHPAAQVAAQEVRLEI
jgi:hypothetical protein